MAGLKLGPGALVAAAFIGPGTVTACTLAGANFGFALLWTLAFATLATIVLQDMSARLGAGAGLGLGEALMRRTRSRVMRWLLGGLVFAALAIGNGAYEAGNLAGASLGLAAITGPVGVAASYFPLAIGVLAGGVLLLGGYRQIEGFLIALVVLMALAFLASVLLVRPDLRALAAGLVPRLPDGSLMTAIALIGTTIVPYNLFLHAGAARQRWGGQTGGADAARFESGLSVGLGGVVSMLILATAAAALFGQALAVRSAGDMALALEPAFGPAARYLIGFGLLAAGLTSAITAPMATAYALTELFPAPDAKRRLLRFRIVALAILAAGVSVSMFGIDTVALIILAQAANGLLLPIIAIVLLAVMNDARLLGAHRNSLASNLAGLAVVALTLGLGLRGVLRALGFWP